MGFPPKEKPGERSRVEGQKLFNPAPLFVTGPFFTLLRNLK